MSNVQSSIDSNAVKGTITNRSVNGTLSGNSINGSLRATSVHYGPSFPEGGEEGQVLAKGKEGIIWIDGDIGGTFIPSVDENGNLSWTNNKGLMNPETVCIKGEKGDEGVGIKSITTTTGYTGSGSSQVKYTRIKFTKTDGTSITTGYIYDGYNGKDGVSPTITVEKIDGGNKVIIKDVEGTKTFNILDGIGGSGNISDKVEENGTEAVSGAAVAAYVTERINAIVNLEEVAF